MIKKKRKEKTVVRCKATKRGVTPCSVLSQAIQSHGCLTAEFVVNFKGKTIKTIYVLHSGDFRGNGIVVNFCPFCGEKIYKE